MSDTQGPRFQVFLQRKAGEPHQDVGSVHAPDPEMALLNARDVFVRRPECVNLWVIPTQAIFSKTAQEIAGGQWRAPKQEEGEGVTREVYYVFNKPKTSGTQTFFGEVMATSPQEALEISMTKIPRDKMPFAWWIFPASLVLQTIPEDIENMFEPAKDKPFRMPQDFHTLTTMREIFTSTEGEPSDLPNRRPPRKITNTDSELLATDN